MSLPLPLCALSGEAEAKVESEISLDNEDSLDAPPLPNSGNAVIPETVTAKSKSNSKPPSKKKKRR